MSFYEKKSLTLQKKTRKGSGDYPGNAAIPRPQGLNPLLGSAFCLFINGAQAVLDPINYTTTRHTGLSAHREGFINGAQAVLDPINYTTRRHTGLSAFCEGGVAHVH